MSKNLQNQHVSTILAACVGAQSCWMHCNLMDCQAPLSMEYSRQAYLKWVAIPSPSGDLPDPGMTCVSCVSYAVKILYHCSTEPLRPIWYHLVGVIRWPGCLPGARAQSGLTTHQHESACSLGHLVNPFSDHSVWKLDTFAPLVVEEACVSLPYLFSTSG